MVQLHFIQPDGTRTSIEAEPGRSVMEVVQSNGIAGIVAECGGSMACATCHAFIDEATIEKIGRSSDMEDEMLDFAATPRRDNSRLTCQVTVTDALEGAEIEIPAEQH
ncbi:2Fe-2S iron-sulfur cluster binding domain-containing protein [Salipiger sp. IMCC34102]|uniref:2Fe-2S iron-sulfur cluster-binding protein n=1 Tax=Salipiger sp. IMCC34102 TaxID=2510647 RepID=UPI00101C2939|nr:2Fe-2S iron-sulfur cluster-binding protein [Salipiger sp. IMCC34102]RYH02124.1 2Fe-2S iron-sulfur cluster binding domain-containing protein [Salipiger sp. IMCC34102]